MAKRMKGLDWFWMGVNAFVSIGVGGLFIDGAFLNVILLKLLPLVLHQVVGWALVVSTIIALFMKLFE